MLQCLEAMRRADALAGFGIPSTKPGLNLAQIQEGLKALRATYLSIHVKRSITAATGVVFIVLRSEGKPEVYEAGGDFLQNFEDLAMGVNQAIIAASTRRKTRSPQHIALVLAPYASSIEVKGTEVYQHLPDGVKEILTDEQGEVFISPYGPMHNLPFELLRTPDGKCLGLKRVLPRVHSFAELLDVARRHPPLADKQVVIVGNPLYDPQHDDPDDPNAEFPRLDGAEDVALFVAELLKKQGYSLIPSGHGPLLRNKATTECWLKTLPQATLGIYAGHGGFDSRGEFLAMANKSKVYPQHVARLSLKGTVMDYACCLVGTTRCRGGGRYDSHPHAALLAGALCCLSSVHLLFDETAKFFSEIFYRKLLDSEQPMTVGNALLAARQATAKQYGLNPLCWGLQVLHGNPMTVLREVGSVDILELGGATAYPKGGDL